MKLHLSPAAHGSSLDSSCRRRPASRDGRGWIPAFAGMTEASCQFVAQTVPAHVSTKEDTKRAKAGIIIIRHFVRFVVNPLFPHRLMNAGRAQIVERLGVVGQDFFFDARV